MIFSFLVPCAGLSTDLSIVDTISHNEDHIHGWTQSGTIACPCVNSANNVNDSSDPDQDASYS